MNLSDQELLELNALCNALADGIITDAERTRLSQMLLASDDARRFYVRAMALSSSLMQYAGEMQSEAPDAPPAAKTRLIRPPAWVWGIGSLAAAAAIVLAFWLGWTKDRSPVRGPEVAEAAPENDQPIARLSGAKDCHWSGPAIQPGDEFHAGQQVKLDSGFAEVTFDCGAQVTLEGPAVLDLNSAWEAVLQRGTLKANVPREAVGFRVMNPSVNVVDLGTEFSMVADNTGATEVFVLKGQVETTERDATGRAGRSIVLHEKQARRFAKAGGSEVRDREAKLDKFMRKIALERFTRPVNYLHWNFDEASGELAAANVPGYEAKLEGSLEGLSNAHAGGRTERALNLDGQLFARVTFPGIHTKGDRTVAFWINVPEDAPLPDAGAILAWPLGNSGHTATVGWNRNPTQGVLGALRTDAGRTSVVGSATLRDGHWHHLAVVFSFKSKAEKADRPDKPEKAEKEMSLLVRQYVDGRLEAETYKHSAKRPKGGEPQLASIEDSLWIGREVDDATGERFHGMLDELFVADAALTPQEIRHLMRENKPATTEMLAAQ